MALYEIIWSETIRHSTLVEANSEAEAAAEAQDRPHPDWDDRWIDSHYLGAESVALYKKEN